jgi:pyruvate dehydrogenase E2 component (dihydrolipoamide acetyltransferase)
MTHSPRGLPIKNTIRLNRVRKAMAQTMKASVDRAAISQVSREIDVTALQAFRRQELIGLEPPISLNTLIMAGVGRTLPRHPLLNSELVDREILVYDTVNLGMAVAVPDGLIVTVIPAAHQLSLVDLNAAIIDKAERARSGKLKITDIEGGTFTVSNLGMYGIDSGFPLPRPPEPAILLVGVAQPKTVVVDGDIVIRDMARFSLNYDHRFIDGATAALFLQDLNDLLANPIDGGLGG